MVPAFNRALISEISSLNFNIFVTYITNILFIPERRWSMKQVYFVGYTFNVVAYAIMLGNLTN